MDKTIYVVTADNEEREATGTKDIKKGTRMVMVGETEYRPDAKDVSELCPLEVFKAYEDEPTADNYEHLMLMTRYFWEDQFEEEEI